jgi:hypothetical protein
METLSELLLYQDTVKRIKSIKNEINSFVRFSSQMRKFSLFTDDIDLPVIKKVYDGVISFFNFVTVDGELYLCLNLLADRRGVIRKIVAINTSLKLCDIDGKRTVKTMGGKRLTSVRNYRAMRGSYVTVVDTSTIFNNTKEKEVRLLQNSFEKTGMEKETRLRFVELGLQAFS